MKKELFAVWAVLAYVAGAPAWASVKCELVPIQSEKEVTIGTKKLKKLTTKYESDVKGACGPKWVNGDDFWLYGDYYPLYRLDLNVSKKDQEQFVKSRPQQPQLMRKVCWDAGDDDSVEVKAKNIIGFYAYQTSDRASVGDGRGVKRDMDLHLLCITPDARSGGHGTNLLNRSIADASASLLTGQSTRVKIVSHQAAEGFYEGLQLTCDAQDEGKVFTGTVEKGGRVERWPLLFDAKECRRVVFDCASVEAVNEARETESLVVGWSMEEAVQNRGQPKPDCVANPRTTTVKFSVLDSAD